MLHEGSVLEIYYEAHGLGRLPPEFDQFNLWVSFQPLPTCPLLARMWIPTKSEPVIKNQDRSLLHEVSQEVQHRHIEAASTAVSFLAFPWTPFSKRSGVH